MEKKIIELHKEINPVGFFLQGIEECKDLMFIPSKGNREAIINKIDALLEKCDEKKFKLILESLKFGFEHPEPFDFVTELMNVLFIYELKKCPLKKIYDFAKKGLRILIDEYEGASLGVRVLTSMAISDLIKGVRQVERDDEVEALLVEFNKKLEIDFEINEENILEHVKNGDFDRKKEYPELLKKGFNLPYSPEEVEKKNLDWFNEVLPEYKKVVEKVKEKFNLKSVEEIDKLLFEKTEGDVLDIAEEYRKKIGKVVKEHLLDISDKHRVNVINTPDYLSSFIPVAAAEAVNYYKGDFDNLLFLTKSGKIDKYFLIDVLVHEEFGHNVNFSNSYDRGVIDKSFMGSGIVIAEATAVYMEKLFFDLIQEVKFSEEEDFDLLYSYVFLKRMLFVYLRAIADVRLNMEIQSTKEFMDWVYDLTGIGGTQLFNQVFNRQFHPGYPTTYPLGLHLLMELRENSKLSQKEFNTKAWSLGFPPLEIYLDLLRE